MPVREPSFTIGIEEEYLLVDRTTLDLVSDPPNSILAECQRLTSKQVTPEFLRSQIEVGTRVCRTVAEARDDLQRLRRVVVDVAGSEGLAPIAASTHPFALWTEQQTSQVSRYSDLSEEMQAAARRLLICGMHVHVGVEDDELRIDLLNQMRYFLPHLLALSTSSPFWEGQTTGLRSYRLTIFDNLPRTGLPEYFESYAEYQRHVDVLINAGLLEDATKIWWDLRPSARYPTLETRIFDVCTRLDDAVSLAAITICLLRSLFRLRQANQRWRIYSPMLLNENRWRAMRYGMDEGLLDLAKGTIVPLPQLIDEIIDLIREDAEALGCVDEVLHAREILSRGTSAHRQLQAYERACQAGASEKEALREVVDFLIEETARGLR
ncbi:MAG: carboxylate-amine ligase [Chromatiales bacterium]|nr:MAG: carboxylate-amine ligase [Chromatiales bacterium]